MIFCKIKGLVAIGNESLHYFYYVHYASNLDSQTLPQQLTQSRHPHGTQEVPLSAASFPT